LASEVTLAITFDYGQRAAPRESERAKAICARLGVAHKSLELPFFASFTRTALVDKSAEVPTGAAVRIDDLAASQRAAQAVWVPNRNGIFLNIAAGFAEGLGADCVVPGFNAEEAATFPDNSEAFLHAATSSLALSTANKVQVRCFTTAMSKLEIVRRARQIHAPLDLAWPCYFGGDEPCGECESCRRFRRAIAGAP
jgi:7-cyano-7-deazaguanine synthase